MVTPRRWCVEWKSTPAERYDTDMLDRARLVVLLHGVEVIGWEGGTDGSSADNAVLVDCTRPEATELAEAISNEVGHKATVERWDS